MHCINISHPDYQLLLEETNLHPQELQARISLWMNKNSDERFPSIDELGIKETTVNTTLKIVNSLNKLQRNIFTQDKLQGWLNDLKKQGVSNQQLDLFKEVAKPGMTKEEIAAAIAANYSYTVEINTAKDKIRDAFANVWVDEYPGKKIGDYITIDNQQWKITGTRFEDDSWGKSGLDEREAFIVGSEGENTNYYSNLTVPGGTNYTENEIATPQIIPSIKGHAQFATDNGIGWFRSDDKGTIYAKDNFIYDGNKYEEIFTGTPFDSGELIYKINDKEVSFDEFIEGKNKYFTELNSTKTRRILEVQSDLFQKGRDKSMLVKVNKSSEIPTDRFTYGDKFSNFKTTFVKKDGKWYDESNQKYPLTEQVVVDGYNSFASESGNVLNQLPSNQFLQLLNKDNNWVTFFVKSIIQDSAKKGYEKVLFPSGDTASKVEGHESLEEFKKQKQDRIKELENKKYEAFQLKNGKFTDRAGLKTYETAEEASALSIKQDLNEINQLKQELERVETEGFGALRPIFNFYETTVANVLKKQGYNPKQVTDEYGNTWNEIEIKPEQTSTILYQVETPNQAKNRILKSLNAQNGFVSRIKYPELLRQVGDYNRENPKSLKISEAASGAYYISLQKQMPQLESKVQEELNKELENKLATWAKTNGIAVEALEDLINRFEGKYKNNILGVADFANQLIGLAEGRALDTMPEEVAHFAIRILKSNNDPSVLRALQNVIYTDEYTQVKEEYQNIYTEEEDFREEALGKVLAKEIVGQFKAPQTREVQPFLNFLRAVKERFLKWVKSKFSKGEKARVEIEQTINPIAIAILNNERIGEMQESKANMLYDIEQEQEEAPDIKSPEDIIVEQKKEFLQKAVAQLNERMQILQSSAKSPTTIAALQNEINKIEYNVAKGELDLSIASFVNLAKSELAQIDKAFDKAIDTGNTNSGTLVMANEFVNMYTNLFIDLANELYSWGIPKEERSELENMIHEVHKTISYIEPKANALRIRQTAKVLKEANTDSYGNVLDPSFDPDMVAKTTDSDVSAWRLHAGNYKYADSKLIKAVHKIIFDSLGKIKRFAVSTANDLLSAQQNMINNGGKIEDLIEKDEDGKLTHYFIREYHWNKYYKTLNDYKDHIAKTLGFDTYNDIKRDFLNEEDAKKFKKLWKDFYKEYTVKVPQPDGSTITVPNNSFKNARYAEVMSNPATKAYYDEIIKKKREAVQKLPIKYRTEKIVYMVPPILKDNLDRLTNMNESYQSRIGKLLRDSVFLDADDTQFGQIKQLNNKMVPVHFTRTLSNTNDLSYDISKTVTLFAEMAENFREKNKIAGDLGVIQLQLAKRNYIVGKEIKKGIETREYKALELLLDSHVFGIERNALLSSKIPSNTVTEKLGIANKQFSWTKASQTFTKFISDNNLALNFATAISGWLKGSGDSVIEDIIGQYTNIESKNWARAEFFKNITEVTGDIGKINQTNKMHLILQQAGIVELEKIINSTNRGRVTRKVLDRDVLYIPFATGDYGVKGRITLAIYDNYRLYNGQFLNKAKFLEKTAKEQKVANDGIHQKNMQKEWESLREKSLYNAYEVVDGKLQIKKEFEPYVTEGVLNTARGKVDNITHYVDGTLSATDKGALSRTILGDFLLMHRGWFIGMVDTRFRKEGKNLITEEEEIGTYRASLDFLWNGLAKTLVTERGNLSAAFATWNKLSPARKRGVFKAGLDLLFLNIVGLIAAMANLAADEEEDDWTTQYLAYQLNRLLVEQGSAWNPSELVQMIDEPVVGSRMIKDLLDITEAVNNEKYEKGMYAGKTHAQKWWMRKIPIKNIYELQFPDLKNNFIKELVDNGYYEMLSDKQLDGITTFQRLGGFFQDDVPQEVDLVNVINVMENDEEGEYNGFN